MLRFTRNFFQPNQVHLMPWCCCVIGCGENNSSVAANYTFSAASRTLKTSRTDTNCSVCRRRRKSVLTSHPNSPQQLFVLETRLAQQIRAKENLAYLHLHDKRIISLDSFKVQNLKLAFISHLSRASLWINLRWLGRETKGPVWSSATLSNTVGYNNTMHHFWIGGHAI